MEGKIEIRDIMRLIQPLTVEGKLEVMNRLTKEIKEELPGSKFNSKNGEDLVDKLYGAWKDMDEEVFNDIIGSRTISDRDINLGS